MNDDFEKILELIEKEKAASSRRVMFWMFLGMVSGNLIIHYFLKLSQ